MSRRFLTPPQLPSGSSLPSAGAAGALFFKSDESKIYVHDGTTWVVAQGSGGGGGVVVSETAPANPTVGDVWFSTSEGVIYVYYDGFWVDPTTGGAAGVPAGGTEGQILAKATGDDYDTTWIDNYAPQIKHLVKNSTGSTLAKGRAVYISGANGTNMLVSYASNATEATSTKTLGVLTQELINNAEGFVVTEGLLSGIDTSTATVGDPVWLGTSGQLLFGMANKPSAPDHMVFMGIVTRVNANTGEMFVKVQNGFELQELHNVDITDAADGEILQYDGTSGLWVNADIDALPSQTGNGGKYLTTDGTNASWAAVTTDPTKQIFLLMGA